MIMDEIKHRRLIGDIFPIEEETIQNTSGNKREVVTTRGWEICVRWKDGLSDWLALKYLKESYPVQLVYYATANGIQPESAFSWWVPFVIRKKKDITSRLNSKYWQRLHTYVIRVPRSDDEANKIDERDGDTKWINAI